MSGGVPNLWGEVPCLGGFPISGGSQFQGGPMSGGGLMSGGSHVQGGPMSRGPNSRGGPMSGGFPIPGGPMSGGFPILGGPNSKEVPCPGGSHVWGVPQSCDLSHNAFVDVTCMVSKLQMSPPPVSCSLYSPQPHGILGNVRLAQGLRNDFS